MQEAPNVNVVPLAEVTPVAPNKRKRMLSLFGLLLAVIALSATAYWKLVASKHVVTDNAYTSADIAQVSSLIGGTIKSIGVIDTQKVKEGDVLATIDDADANLNLKQAQAETAKARVEMSRALANLERRKKLIPGGFISKEEINNAETAYQSAKAAFDAASAHEDEAKLNLDRTVIRAPIDGIVAKRDVQLGQRIAAGTHLLSIVPTTKIFVNANFKEVQLAKLKIGQKVKIKADVYGSSVIYKGKVTGISGGTGSAFAIIPAQNATGNWIKVVQRLPVRIDLDPKSLTKHPLQVGLSMHVDVNID